MFNCVFVKQRSALRKDTAVTRKSNDGLIVTEEKIVKAYSRRHFRIEVLGDEFLSSMFVDATINLFQLYFNKHQVTHIQYTVKT